MCCILKKLIFWLDEHFEEVILMILLIVITGIMGLQVIFRYLFNQSLSWSEELTRYVFIYMCFISISYCTKKWISIKIDQIISLFSDKAYTFLQLILNCILFVLFVYLSIHAYIFLMQGIATKQLSPALQIPMWWIQAAPLIGFVLASIRSFQQIFYDIRTLTEGGKRT